MRHLVLCELFLKQGDRISETMLFQKMHYSVNEEKRPRFSRIEPGAMIRGNLAE